MDQSITHTLARGQQEDTADASPQGRPVERVVRPPTVASPPPVVPAAPPEALLRAIDKKPGQRLLARSFDLLLFTVLFEAALIYVWPQAREGRLLLLALVPGFLLYLLLDAMFMAWFGATPGKSLLRIRVVPAAGGKMGWRGALKRSFRVGWKGLAMGLPGVNLVTLQASRKRLLSNGRTAWDQQGNFYVLHGRIGVMRTLAFIACSLFLVMAGSIIRLLGQERSPGIPAMAYHEADVAPPTQVEPSPPVPVVPPAPAAGQPGQPGADDTSAVQLMQDQVPTKALTRSAVAAAGSSAVATAAKAMTHARHAGKHTLHHTRHPSVLLPPQSSASRHLVHPKKAPTSIAAHPRPGPRTHHATTTAVVPMAGDHLPPAENQRVRASTKPEASDAAADGNQPARQRGSIVRQEAAGRGADLPDQAAPGPGTVWQPLTAAQALDADNGDAGAGSVTAPTGKASPASYPVAEDSPAQGIGDRIPAAEDRAAQAVGAGAAQGAGAGTARPDTDSHRPVMTDDTATAPGQRLAGATGQPAAFTSGGSNASAINASQSGPVLAAVPDANQAGGSEAGIPASAQFSDSPINVTPQVR